MYYRRRSESWRWIYGGFDLGDKLFLDDADRILLIYYIYIFISLNLKN